jgi:chorismate synthase
MGERVTRVTAGGSKGPLITLILSVMPSVISVNQRTIESGEMDRKVEEVKKV